MRVARRIALKNHFRKYRQRRLKLVCERADNQDHEENVATDWLLVLVGTSLAQLFEGGGMTCFLRRAAQLLFTHERKHVQKGDCGGGMGQETEADAPCGDKDGGYRGTNGAREIVGDRVQGYRVFQMAIIHELR